MRIGIDIRSVLKQQKAGIGYYTLNLINSLACIDAKNNYLLYSKIKFFSKNKKLPVLSANNFRHKIDRFGLGPQFLLRQIDIFHTSSFDIKPPKSAKYIVTIHDIIPKVYPQGHTQDTINRLDSQIGYVIENSDVIIADTNCTKNDLINHYPASKDKIKVVYPGVGDEFAVMPADTKNLYKNSLIKYNISSNYIIYIGTLEPRKNVTGLIKAYNILKSKRNTRQKLVIAGMKGWGWEVIFQLVDSLGLKNDVIFTGYVPREDLKILYNFADICVYPSFYEGAGLPVLEAFKCGCPLVTSNTSSIPELAGNAAVMVDPASTEALTEGMYKLLTDEALRNELRNRGFKQAEEFTWDRTAKQFLKIFEEAPLRGRSL